MAFFTCWARSSASLRALSLSLKRVKKDRKINYRRENILEALFRASQLFKKKCFDKDNLKRMKDGPSSFGTLLILCTDKNAQKSVVHAAKEFSPQAAKRVRFQIDGSAAPTGNSCCEKGY